MSQLICKDLAIGHEGNVVLDNINFTVEAANYLCILGENGSGKSTLMKTILGLIPPLSGEVKMEDAKKIGYLAQQTQVQKDFPASVEEIVQSGCLAGCGFRFYYTKEEKIRAEKAMEQLGVLELRKKCYRELSGGQQERVLLARAICTTHKMLLLDEPVSGLDPRITQEMYEIIDKLNRIDKVTIIMISHDVQAAYQYATHILYLGEKQFFGTRDEYIQWKDLEGGNGDGFSRQEEK